MRCMNESLYCSHCISVSYQDCTSAVDPGGASGREWCYVEVRMGGAVFGGWHFGVFFAMCEEQVANADSKKWDYCAPKPNYADVRQRVGNAFGEKANEIADAIDIVQGLSKETVRLLCISCCTLGGPHACL